MGNFIIDVRSVNRHFFSEAMLLHLPVDRVRYGFACCAGGAVFFDDFKNAVVNVRILNKFFLKGLSVHPLDIAFLFSEVAHEVVPLQAWVLEHLAVQEHVSEVFEFLGWILDHYSFGFVKYEITIF